MFVFVLSVFVVNLNKRVGKDRVFLGLAGPVLGKSLGAALPALGKPRPSLLFYTD